MSRKSPAPGSESQRNVGKAILKALSEEEVALLLEELIASIPPKDRETAVNRLPTDTRETLQQLLREWQSPGLKTKAISLAKLSQKWSDLWQKWENIVWSATEEEGKYLEQEEHWEPPYFDDGAFIEDLESLGAQMLPLLPTAYESELTPKAEFAKVLKEMAEEIGNGLPEWIRLVNEGFYLGSSLTSCLLNWEWLKAQEEGLDAFDFTQGIRDWEEEAQEVALEPSAFFNFFAQLEDGELQRIYEGLTENREALSWKSTLKNIHSHWHELYLYCLERYDPERRLLKLRESIPQEWRHGLPVLEDLLGSQAYQESLVVIEETLESKLKSIHYKDSWVPEDSLLITLSRSYYERDDSSPQARLLGYYQRAAEGLAQSERVEALKIQLTAYEHCFNWSTMLEAFRQGSVSVATRRNLWQSWRDYIIGLMEGEYWSWGSSQADSSWWLPWLLDSTQESQREELEFPRRIKQWLGEVQEELSPSRQDFLALRLLTYDLGEIRQENWHQYPNFLAVVLETGRLKTADSESRQSFLKQLAAKDLWKEVMAYWELHLDRWIPKPETAQRSDYRQQAKWVAAWRELSPTAYQNLLAQWRVEHKKRRNLWKALAQMGFS